MCGDAVHADDILFRIYHEAPPEIFVLVLQQYCMIRGEASSEWKQLNMIRRVSKRFLCVVEEFCVKRLPDDPRGMPSDIEGPVHRQWLPDQKLGSIECVPHIGGPGDSF